MASPTWSRSPREDSVTPLEKRDHAAGGRSALLGTLAGRRPGLGLRRGRGPRPRHLARPRRPARGPRGSSIACARNEGTRLAEQMPWGRPERGPIPRRRIRPGRPRGRRLARPAGHRRRGRPADRRQSRQRPALAGARPLRPLEDGRRPYADESARARCPGRARRAGAERPVRAHDPRGRAWGRGSRPVVLGMDRVPSAALVRVRWPDGTLQCELNVPADQVLAVVEHNRKTGSCPVLFAWDGDRFACIGDFLGGGGLGYLVAPGVYGQPDRDEAVAIAPGQLAAVAGRYRLVVAEPMDEVAYLDRLTLDVVDRPAEIAVAPDERFAPGGNRPSGELVAWRTAIEPVRATDLEGRDVADRLRAADGRTVDRIPAARRLDRLRRGARHRARLRRPPHPVRAGRLALARTRRLGRVPVLADQLRGGDRRRRTPAAVGRAPARRRLVGDDRARRRLSRGPAAADAPRPVGEAHRAGLRDPAADEHGMLLGPGVHRGPGPRGRGRGPRHAAAGGAGVARLPRVHARSLARRSAAACSTTTTTWSPPRWRGCRAG